ncbi:hypothetical protein CKAN_02665900 [Cinnamomum micranthum f. kanehirae]|uniref:Uncharacterized protein n=1 Tax=Cinnamomum micranthum f. kanehirae TaxID=337451 RepID=A0A443Q2L3_9MAGN|nr:hypothetical protein CKAN_02665900 [Cinnamomum micranthum f. kanehirae]
MQPQLIEMDLDSESDGEVVGLQRRLEGVIHGLIVCPPLIPQLVPFPSLVFLMAAAKLQTTSCRTGRQAVVGGEGFVSYHRPQMAFHVLFHFR